VAQQAAERMRAAGSAQVVSVETERVREGPPLPFDLGTLQEVCSKQLGLDVQETLDIAQALYETHKATTYPRSDSGYLPESMLAEVPTVLDSLVKTDPSLRPLIDRLDPPSARAPGTTARSRRTTASSRRWSPPTCRP
jgi:DNA topoisomerase-3